MGILDLFGKKEQSAGKLSAEEDELVEKFFQGGYFNLSPDEYGAILGKSKQVNLGQLGSAEWRKIRYLYIDRMKFGTRHGSSYFLCLGGSLLIVNQQDDNLNTILAKCSPSLRCLRISCAHFLSIDLSRFMRLERVYIESKRTLPEAILQIIGVENLDRLKKLRLIGSFDDCFLNVAGMKNLEELEICSFSHPIMVEGFSSQSRLRKIALENVDAVWDQDYAGSSALEDLQLMGMTPMSRIPDLKLFPNLRHCALSGEFADIPYIDLSGLKKLERLDIKDIWSLEEILGSEDLDCLTSLTINGTSMLFVPAGLRGKPLTKLGLINMTLHALPDWLPEFGMEFGTDRLGDGICLENTTVEGVDMSIFDQPQEMILQWFEERKKQNQVRLDEIKVVFLGDGEAGKSHTIARLLNDGGEPVDYTDQSTPGIVIKHKVYRQDSRKFKVHYWDFGGQEILHSMHRIFLTERTLYVVLVNARDETQDVRARYWLHNIRSFAPGAPVLLVLNKIDQNPKAKVNEPDLRERYENLRQVIPMSALEFDRERFNREFTRVLLEEILQTGYLDVQWPLPWTQVKAELEHMETNYIRGDDYQKICRKYSVDKNEKNLLHWFNDLGVSYCCCDDHKLEDYMILRPEWITNALYIILFNNCPGARNGLVPHSTIDALLRKDSPLTETIRRVLPGVYYKWDEISYVLEVFRKSQLSFCAGDAHEFIPMLCDPASAPAAQRYAKDEKVLEFRMEFDYLPNNLLHQLMVDRKDELRMDQVWRTGALFEQKETGFSAVVAIDGDMLRFFVRSTDSMHRPNTYLAMLKANVDRIRRKMGLRAPGCSVVYKRGGKQDVFDYEMLRAMLEAGQKEAFSMTWRQMLKISDIMNQSAPETLEEEDRLLGCVIRSCQNIQGDMRYIGSDEDDRNSRMRDDLRLYGYEVHDQTRRGSSASGKSAGELDLEIRRNGAPWTVIEALRVRDGSKTKWNEHLDKLLGHYNAHGAAFMFLVTYVDDGDDSFGAIWDSYKKHIAQHSTQRYSCRPGSFEPAGREYLADNRFIRAACCRYSCGGRETAVYHIFVRIGK